MPGRPKRKAAADTEVRAKRARGETDLGHDLIWKNEGNPISGLCPLLTLNSDTLPGAEKVASFDVDFTIIKTASGRKFAIGSNDWEFWDEKVPTKLKELHEDGYRIIFFTNQAGIEKGKVTPDSFKLKMEDIIRQLDIPILVFASTGVNCFRKPYTAMWEFFLEKCNQGVEVDKSVSWYVGDAAGRAKNWAKDKPKDFSCGDRMFAKNCGLKFGTPEEFFLGEKAAPFEWRSIDPVSFLEKNPAVSKADDKSSYASKSQELVIMVGQPASGKSTFCKRYFVPQGYVAVNRDTMGTMEKCIKVAKEALKAGKSVITDNTNPSVTARANFVKLAKDAGVPCRCIVMKTSEEMSHHLNLFRQSLTKGAVRRVPDVGYNVFKKNFEAPKKSEGFSEILELGFKPRFDCTADEELFKQWTG